MNYLIGDFSYEISNSSEIIGLIISSGKKINFILKPQNENENNKE